MDAFLFCDPANKSENWNIVIQFFHFKEFFLNYFFCYQMYLKMFFIGNLLNKFQLFIREQLLCISFFKNNVKSLFFSYAIWKGKWLRKIRKNMSQGRFFQKLKLITVRNSSPVITSIESTSRRVYNFFLPAIINEILIIKTVYPL